RAALPQLDGSAGRWRHRSFWTVARQPAPDLRRVIDTYLRSAHSERILGKRTCTLAISAGEPQCAGKGEFDARTVAAVELVELARELLERREGTVGLLQLDICAAQTGPGACPRDTAAT